MARVSAAITKLTDPDGFKLGARHITVSTVGLVPGIRKITEHHPQVGLAVSFHASTRDIRWPNSRQRWPTGASGPAAAPRSSGR